MYTIGAEKPDLTDLARQLAALWPKDRQALAKILSGP